MMTPYKHEFPKRPTLVLTDPVTGDQLSVWPAVLEGDRPSVQIDAADEAKTSLQVSFALEDGPKLVAAILAAIEASR